MPDVTSSECEKAAALDPRIRRSRQMLHDALAGLLSQKEFDKISIQEIAERSGLNRATFYSHYPDKFTLLNCMVGSRFHALMAKRNIRVNDCGGALKAIALGVCDFLVEMPGVGGGQVEGNIQTAIVGVVERILLEGMSRRESSGPVSPKLVAATVAWAIYGAAHNWVRTEGRCSAEHMAEALDKLISPMMRASLQEQPAGV